MFPRLVVSLLLLAPMVRAATIGNSPAAGGILDGYSAILVVDETDTYTNTAGGAVTVTPGSWNVSIGAVRGRVTPFIVRVNGNDSFTVLAIGTTRVAGIDYASTGVKTFPFAGSPPTFTVNAGDKIAAGYSDANPNGSGNAGSVVPFFDGGDEIWLTGGFQPSNAGTFALGTPPAAGPGGTTYTTLARQYQYNIAFTTVPVGPVPPTDIQLAPLDIFPSSPVGAIAGTLTATDANTGDTFTYALIGGPAIFAIAGDKLTLIAVPGAIGTSYTVHIRVLDQTGRAFDKDFTLKVAAPLAPTGLACSAQRFFTATAINATLGRFTTTDDNTADAFTYALVAGVGDADNALFSIAGDLLNLAQPMPATASVSFRVRSTDRAGLSIEHAFTVPVSAPTVRINEFVAENSTGLTDEDGAQSDWIELFNPLATGVNLAGWHLTDDPAMPAKWTFPAVGIPAGGYLVVFASGKDRVAQPGNLHTNFNLDSAGEYLALTQPDGTIADAYAAREQATDLAYGYDGAGAGQGYLTPTPGAANGPSFAHGINKVTFSLPRGFYTAAQTLTLAADVAGSVIRYTTDGTKPSGTSPSYTGPILIVPDTAGVTRGTKIVRAVAQHATAAANRVVTNTYLFVNGVAGPSTDGIVSQTNTNNAAQTAAIRANPTYAALLDDGLLSLPALAITNPAGLPTQSETESSVELIAPGGTEAGFHINCGIQAVGNSSIASPKNNFRLYFRSDYGESTLKYDLFAGHPYDPHGAVKSFNRLNVRSCSHDTFFWLADPSLPPAPGTPADALYLRNIIMDDLQFQMGNVSTHGRYVNCFVNGQYHGLYHVFEYPNTDFIASYLPGPKSQFEFTNGANPAENGSANWQTPWNTIKTLATTAGAANYTELKRWLDVQDLADFAVLNFWAGNNWDWNPNQNWIGAGPNVPDAGGWKFFSYDNDIIWMSENTSTVGRDVPDSFFNALMATHPDFQVLVRDRAYRHMFHGGVLTSARASATLTLRENQIRLAIVNETARWQPAAATLLPWDRDGEWQAELNRMKNTFFPARCAIVIAQLKAQGWYPVDAPEFGQYGGSVPAGYHPTVTGPSGAVIYATTDGSDPRLPGGAVNPAAIPLSPGAITISTPTLVRLRATTSGDWSPLNEAAFTLNGTVAASAANIAISEIHYHPAAGGQEFIELMNVSAAPADLSGVQFTSGIDFQFPANTVLAPGARVVVAEAQFLNGSHLSDGGERLTLVAADGTTVIRNFTYSDSAPWPAAPDGTGPSLVLIAPSAAHATDAYHADGIHWRSSIAAGGNPGTSDATAFTGNPAADIDADGFSALLEYALGTSDTDNTQGRNACSIAADAALPGGYLFTYQRASAADDLIYIVETSIDLLTWTPVSGAPLNVIENGATKTLTFRITLPGNPPSWFARLRVVAP